MNKLICFVVSLVSLSCIGANVKSESDTTEKVGNMNGKKVLVAYFSRTGENYNVGNIKEGNTAVIAKMIAGQTGGELFEIVPEKDYPVNYKRCTEVAKEEYNAKARPAIKGDAKVEDFDIIFIGYPIWWSDAPMPVYSFIEKHSWQGKTVIPFCTHEGSGYCNAAEIKAAVNGAAVKNGLAINGTTAQNKRDEALSKVRKWLGQLGL